jgi:hypothetical protein
LTLSARLGPPAEAAAAACGLGGGGLQTGSRRSGGGAAWQSMLAVDAGAVGERGADGAILERPAADSPACGWGYRTAGYQGAFG